MLYDTKFNFVGQYFFSDLCISSLDYCNIGLPYNIIWSYPLAFFSSQYSVLVSLLLLFIEVIWNFIFPVYFSFFHIILIVLCGHSDLVVQSVSFCHSLLSTSTAVCLVLNQTSSALCPLHPALLLASERDLGCLCWHNKSVTSRCCCCSVHWCTWRRWMAATPPPSLLTPRPPPTSSSQENTKSTLWLFLRTSAGNARCDTGINQETGNRLSKWQSFLQDDNQSKLYDEVI